MNNAWECPRCNAINSPVAFQCKCTPIRNLIQKLFSQEQSSPKVDGQPTWNDLSNSRKKPLHSSQNINWISIYEKLPEYERKIIMYDGYNIEYGILRYGGFVKFSYVPIESAFSRLTHWAYLADLPPPSQ